CIYCFHESTTCMTIPAKSAAPTPTGTALKRISLNNTDWSIVFGADPRIRLPPEENGEIAEACAPTITQTNSSMGLNPVARAIPGTTGNSAGATTPSVLANRDI